MKKFALIAAALLATGSASAAELTETKPTRPKGVPEDAQIILPGAELKLPPVEKLVTYTPNYYKDQKFNDKYMGKLAAVEGTIAKIEPGPHNQSIYHIDLKEGVKKQLWVASMVVIDEGFVKVGTQVRILGYFDKTAEEKEYMAKLSNDTEYLLGMCFYDTEIGRPMYRPRWMDMCLKWENGVRLPKLIP